MNQKKRRSRIHLHNEGYLFILPIFVLFGVYSIYPLIFNIYCSFLKWNGMSTTKEFVGLANYAALLNDPVLPIMLRNTVLYFIGTIIPQAVFGVVLAYIITRRVKRSNFFRAFLYSPNIIPLSIICITFMKIFQTHDGDLNRILESIGLGAFTQEWLARPGIALFSLILINVWTYTSFSMYLYCVSMTNISEDIYEAATIDGANGIQQFFRITVPMLGSTHMTLILLGMISVMKNFDIPYIVTGGGPARSTEFFSTYMYEMAFDRFNQGTASTIVQFMIAICLVLTIFQLRMYGVRVEKGGGK